MTFQGGGGRDPEECEEDKTRGRHEYQGEPYGEEEYT